MMIKEMIGKILAGERDGTTLWKIAINEIDYPTIADPAEGVTVAALAENILRCGQLQPILVYRMREDDNDRPYHLIAGRRRIEAMRMLGNTHVSAIVVRCTPEKAEFLALSENLLHREQDLWRLAADLKRAMDGGLTEERLAALLGLSVLVLREHLELLQLPEDEIRMMRFARVSLQDIRLLKGVPASVRREILERCCAASELQVSDLVREWKNAPERYCAGVSKVCLGDVRLFLNTVDRAVQMVKSAGYDVRVDRSSDIESHIVTLRVAKKAGATLKDVDRNVSRETPGTALPKERFSSALNIFEAIAEDERACSCDVSCETSVENCSICKEIPEKLELSID